METKNREIIKSAFEQLSRQDQCLIFEMVYIESGITSDDCQWGEHHAFDDMNVFCRAIRKAVSIKFDRLSVDDKNKVFGEIERLAKPETEEVNWGKNHAFDNVLLLIDAMNNVT